MKKSVLIFAAAAALLSLAGCKKEAPAPVGTVTAAGEMTVPFYGGAVTYTLESNCPWEVTSTTVDVVPVSGEGGTTELTVTVPANTGSSAMNESFTITFTNADGVTSVTTVEVVVPAPSVTYGGVTYNVVYLPDGKYWMAENLRYVPEGMTPSSDPADGSGLWYSYEVVDGTASALTDDASVAANGLLYSAAVAFGVDEVNADNYKNLECAQGICPEGWHIPSRSEWFTLCGASTKADGEESAPENDPNAIFWDAEAGYANIAAANASGFNFCFGGSVISGKYNNLTVAANTTANADWVGVNRMNYILGSTGYTTNSGGQQMFALMTTFTTAYDGRLSLSYSNIPNGVQVRCVKD